MAFKLTIADNNYYTLPSLINPLAMSDLCPVMMEFWRTVRNGETIQFVVFLLRFADGSLVPAVGSEAHLPLLADLENAELVMTVYPQGGNA